jgi:wyosine [tRNA(Phe)-imidazoG37] synthetase (radical SAM superfamily)
LIERLKTFGIKVAVFTNGSLLWRDDIKDDLSEADLVSIKIDTVDEDVWRHINQPFSDLKLKSLLDGIRDFTKHFKGNVITETMFVKGLNDSRYSISNISEFISTLKIERSYLALPVRPPALINLKAASMSVIDFALDVFGNNNIPATSLIQDTALDFSHTDNFIEELLSIISVHPMNRDAVDTLLKKANLEWKVMKGLLDRNEVVEVEYNGAKYYQKRFEREKVI